MGNRLGRLAILIAIAAIVLVGIGATVNAQNDRAVCRDARYDINGDGLFTRVDPNAWKGTFARENCELGSAVVDCSAKLDLDGDQLVTRADLDQMIRTAQICFAPLATDVGR